MADQPAEGRMVTLSIQLSRETDAALDTIRDQHGIPKSAFIRLAVAERLARFLPKAPKQRAS